MEHLPLPRVLLIDTDALIWKYSLVNRSEPRDPFGFGEEEPLDSLSCAKRDFSLKLEFLQKDFSPCTLYLCLPTEDSVNFRYELFPSYKKTRGERPEIIVEMYKWVRETYTDILLMQPDIETDDIIADLTYALRKTNQVIIVSNDKDFRQIPGWHLHPFHGDLENISDGYAHGFFWRQVLMGDGADCIPGCPGIGETKAATIIVQGMLTSANLEDIVHFTYLSQGATFEDFALNYRLCLLGNKNYRMDYRKLPEPYIKLLEELKNGS